MKTKHCIAGIMAWVVLVTPCLQIRARAEAAGAPEPKTPVYFSPALPKDNPAGVYATLWAKQQSGQLSFEENMDMAMALFLQQQWERAAGVYKNAAAQAAHPARKAAAMAGAAPSLAAAQKWGEAGRLMNEANRLVPNSKEAAALRFAYWSNAGDALETRVAQDRMKQLNLNSEGTPVCVGIAIVAILAITAITVTWVIVAKPSAVDFKKAATAAFATIAAIAGEAMREEMEKAQG